MRFAERFFKNSDLFSSSTLLSSGKTAAPYSPKYANSYRAGIFGYLMFGACGFHVPVCALVFLIKHGLPYDSALKYASFFLLPATVLFFYIPCRFANRTNQSIFKVPYTVPEILRAVSRFCGHGFCNAFRYIRKFCFCKCALMRVDSLRQFVYVLRIACGGKKN